MRVRADVTCVSGQAEHRTSDAWGDDAVSPTDRCGVLLGCIATEANVQWTVIIPVKALPNAKSRLTAASPDDAAHARLVTAMRRDTAHAARNAATVARVLIVADRSGDPTADLVQSVPGLNEGVSEAASFAAQRWPADGIAALVGDLPALRSQELAAALADAADHPRAFVADAAGTGTTLLTARPGVPLSPSVRSGLRRATCSPCGGGLRRAGLADRCRHGRGLATSRAPRVRAFHPIRHRRLTRAVDDDEMTRSLPVSSIASSAIDPADSVPGGDLEPERAAQAVLDLPPDRFSNREMSWLSFNARVLALGEDRRQPLLERLKFLAIFASNLDEFFMVRIAGLQRRADMGLQIASPDGLSPRETLAKLAERIRELADRHARCFLEDVQPALAAEGIRIVRWADLNEEERRRLGDYFRSKVFPVLTPLAVDPAHPFPYISGLSLESRGARPRSRRRPGELRAGQGPQQRPAIRGRIEIHAGGGVPAAGGPDRRAPVDAVSRHGGRRTPPVPRDAQRRLRSRRGPRRGPAAGARA